MIDLALRIVIRVNNDYTLLYEMRGSFVKELPFGRSMNIGFCFIERARTASLL